MLNMKKIALTNKAKNAQIVLKQICEHVIYV